MAYLHREHWIGKYCRLVPSPVARAEVWHVNLAFSEPDVGRAWRVLVADEQARAARFAFAAARSRFVAARAALRILLGSELGVDPQVVSFRLGPHGKPSLDGHLASAGTRFNLSHSGDSALVAIACGREVGVDIENVRVLDSGLPAISFFAEAERAWVMSRTAEARTRAFFSCWTAKEAYIKARGDGLAFPLRRFQALPQDGSCMLRLEVHGDPAESSRWRLLQLPSPLEWVGTLGIEADHATRPTCFS